MKKSIIAVVLAIATLVTFIIPASAWAWAADGKFEHTSYNIARVEAGTIKVDGVLEDAYRDGDRIESYPDAEPYRRGAWKDHPEVLEVTRGEFWAYVAVDPTGLYIYAEIEDETIFDTNRDGNANEGDMIQLYFDWCEPSEDAAMNMAHPSPKVMYNQYLLEGTIWEDAFNYRGMYGANGMMYLGWIAFDYHGQVNSAWGFSPHETLGLMADKSIQSTTELTGDGWKCEVFVPWREESQGERVAAGEQFHCGLGFQIANDSDLYDVVDYQENGKPMPEKSVGITFDQRKEIGLSYYIRYSALADLMWADSYPEGYWPDDDTIAGGETIETSDSVIAVVAALAVAGAGVALFSIKKKED